MDLAAIAALADQVADAAPMPEHRQPPALVPGRVLLVDGDYLAYFCAGSDETSPGEAKRNAISRIGEFKRWTGSDRIVVHLTSEGSTKGDRFAISTVKPYQGKRKSGGKPKNWQFLRDWMEQYDGQQFAVRIWNDREADDGIAYDAQVLGWEKAAIATADKDMRMLPGVHVTWKDYLVTEAPRHVWDVYNNDLQYGHKWFWLQCLQGDTVDNIPGLPYYVENGKQKLIGDKGAEQKLAVATDDTLACIVVAGLYHTTYGADWANRLAEQMLLLWLRRDSRASFGDCMRHLDIEHEGLRLVLIQAIQRIEQRVKEMKESLPCAV